jgi:hypothetical protein
LISTLPPEPNLDASAVATLTGTGGAACTAAAVLPNIVVSGVTVATGNAAVPIKDASGFYHFKPSCYGYLNPSSLSGGGGIVNVRTGLLDGPATKDVFPSLPAPSTAGDLLVVTITSETSPSNKPFTAPAGWVSALAGGAFLDGTAHTEIWYYPNNPGAISNADFGISPASINAVAQMSEWSGVALASPLDRTGISLVSVAGKNQTVSTSAATTAANELVITGIGFSPTGAGNAYTPGAGWSSLIASTANGFSSDYRTNLPAAVASEAVTYSVNATWSSMIATFKPAAAGAAGAAAVLDPGFYYFNGSGFAGGGGICLNGGTLLARDVTLEFVNTAGFSSGTCAAAGGAACAAPCALGSDPANAAADSPNNLTWFASPCTFAPGAGNASCPGSAWCPAGDRSCTNRLIWAPASSTGQINLKGAVNKAWLLGSVSWPGTCNIQVNGTGTIAGNVACGPLSLTAGVGAGLAVGSDSGISTALVEALLVE